MVYFNQHYLKPLSDNEHRVIRANYTTRISRSANNIWKLAWEGFKTNGTGALLIVKLWANLLKR
jgi:hypothetical protein